MPKRQPCILVVEDELLIAMDVESMALALGCTVVGPLATIQDALDAVRDTAIDGAVLDINLGDERVWPVADALAERGIPFVLASGYSRVEVPPRFSATTVIAKPLTETTLREGLGRAGILA